MFGVKFDQFDQAEWIEITMTTLMLDLVALSFLKVMFVWLVPQVLLGVFILLTVLSFLAISAWCGTLIAEIGLDGGICNFLTL